MRVERGLVVAPPGIGKSREAVATAYEFVGNCRVGDEASVAILAATTIAQRNDWILFADHQHIPHIVIEGRNDSNCDRLKIVQAVGELGHRPGRCVCTGCPHFMTQQNDCQYWQPILDALKRGDAFLIFVVHESVPGLLAMFHHHRPSAIKLVEFDESPHRAFVVDHRIANARWSWPMGLNEWDLMGATERVCRLTGEIVRNEELDHIRALLPVVRHGDTILRALVGVVLRDLYVASIGQNRVVTLRTRPLVNFLQMTADREGLSLDGILTDVFATQVEDLLEWLGSRHMRTGTLEKARSMVPRQLPGLVRALAHDLCEFRAGRDDWNSSLRIVPAQDGRAKIYFSEVIKLPHLPDRVLILDGTGDIDRTGLLFRDRTMPVHEIKVRPQWRSLVHVSTNASRRRLNSKERNRLMSHVTRAVKSVVQEFGLEADSQLLAVTHGSRNSTEMKEQLAARIRTVFPGDVVCAHYAELRGRNDYCDADFVVTIGDNEPNPLGLRDHYACLHAEDADVLSLQMNEQADGSRQLDDPRLERWRRLTTLDDIAQAAFRCRPLDKAGRCIYLHVGSRWPTEHLGPPDRVIDPHFDIERGVILDRFEAFIRTNEWYSSLIGELAGWHGGEREYGHHLGREPWWMPFRKKLLAHFGVEDVTGVVRPYSIRRFRDLAHKSLVRFREHVVDLSSLGHGVLLSCKVWGNVDAFRARFSAALQMLANVKGGVHSPPKEIVAPPMPNVSEREIEIIARSPVPMAVRNALKSDGYIEPWRDQPAEFRRALADLLLPLCEPDAFLDPVGIPNTAAAMTYTTGNGANKNILLFAPFPVAHPKASWDAYEDLSTDDSLHHLDLHRPLSLNTPEPAAWERAHCIVQDRWRLLLAHHADANDVALAEALAPILSLLPLSPRVRQIFLGATCIPPESGSLAG